MLPIPAQYDYINVYNGTKNPSSIHATDNALAQFFQRYLLQEAISIYKWDMPKTWAKDYTLYSLFVFGYVAIIETDRFGVIPQACNLYGYDVFYRPTNANIANPLLKGILQPRIGKECTIIKLQPDYCGIMDLVSRYSALMALTMQTAASNIAASKLAYVFSTDSKNGAETFKKLMDRIMLGEPGVVIDNKLSRSDGSASWQMFNNNLSNNYIAGDLMQDLAKLKNMFYTDIGIPNANTDKKERLITDEVNANNVATYSKADMWLENITEGIENAIEMFPGLKGKLSAEWRFPKGGGNVAEYNVNTGPDELHARLI